MAADKTTQLHRYWPKWMLTQGSASSPPTEFYDFFAVEGAEIAKITVATQRSNLLLSVVPLPGERQ